LSGWSRVQEDSNTPPSNPATPTEPDDEEDPEHPKTTAPSNIVERSLIPKTTQGYEAVDDIYVLNRTSKAIDVAALAATPIDITLTSDSEPQILIMHTHGSEAHTQDGEDIYSETDTARTTDPHYNIIRVGDEIERIFKEMGLSVLHDRELYDYPSYNGAYDRSKAAVQQYLKDYPSIKIVLDIHRDALVGQDGTIYKAVSDIDGSKAAQVLMVMGSDDGGLSHPNWQKNLGLAMKIQQQMNTLWPGLARPITLRSSRFNQQLTTGSILVEIGSHGNTLQEALEGARHFARSAGHVFQELKE
jgi:stage II sporulation protein P